MVNNKEEEFEEDEDETSLQQTQDIVNDTLDSSIEQGFRSHSLSEIVPVLDQAETGIRERGFQRVIIQSDEEEEEQVSYGADNQKRGEGDQTPRNEYRPQDDYTSTGSGNYSSFSSSSSGSNQRMIGESRQVFGRGPIPESNWGSGGTGRGFDSIGRDNLSGNTGMGAGSQSKNYEDDPEKRMRNRKRTM